MTLERWQVVKAVFEQALERAAEERATFLDQACGENAALRREVESLLEADETADGFLERPATCAFGEPDLQDRLSAALADRYRIERELRSGGMSRVFVAQEAALGRRVVVKALPRGLATMVNVKRFRREVRVAASLQHPHVVPLLAAGEADDLLYYTMPYLEGDSLRERLQHETRLSVRDAVRIAREIADALSYAHGRGILHRDIKPENILLSGAHALVTDFGIAHALQAADEGPDARLTGSGVLLGTPAYMSPEQATRKRGLDGRSDIYALGCVLYEMLTGQPTWTGPTPLALIAKRLADPAPSVRGLCPDVPEPVERAVRTALAREPADRFQSCAQFAEVLAREESRL